MDNAFQDGITNYESTREYMVDTFMGFLDDLLNRASSSLGVDACVEQIDEWLEQKGIRRGQEFEVPDVIQVYVQNLIQAHQLMVKSDVGDLVLENLRHSYYDTCLERVIEMTIPK